MRLLLALLSLAVLAPGCGFDSSQDRYGASRFFTVLAKDYVSERLLFYPVEATLAGYHVGDGSLGDYRRERLENRLARLRDLRQKLLGVDPTKLSRSEYIDFLLLTNAVKAEILELEEVASWRRSPRFYSQMIRCGISSLLNGRPLTEARMQSLLSRLGEIPPLLDTARANLDLAPRLWVEEGIAELRSCRRLIEDLPTALGRDSSPRKLAELGERSREVARATEAFIAYLEAEILPEAPSSFALGSEMLSRKLLYEEMVETPLDVLRAMGEREIRETQSQWLDMASRLEPSRDPVSLLNELTEEHPSASELLTYAGELVQDLRSFVVEQDLIGIVPERPFQILEMPYLLDGESIIIQTPGPWEDPSAGSALAMALPRPEWPLPQTEVYLRDLNSRSLRLVVARGLGSHLLHSNIGGSEIRKMLISRAHRDGWAGYFQQMLLDEGYHWDDPVLRYLLLRSDLVDQCRWVSAIGLHTEDMNVSDAVRLFRDEAYLETSQAEREAMAVAVEPALMYAGLAKRLLFELRRDYLNHGDPVVKLREFHDAVLATGGLPLRLVRQELLEGSPSSVQ